MKAATSGMAAFSVFHETFSGFCSYLILSVAEWEKKNVLSADLVNWGKGNIRVMELCSLSTR